MTTAERMSCQELVEVITDYLEGKLSAADVERFEDHLGTCSGCRAYLEQMRTTLRAVGMLREDDLEPEAAERLLNAFRGWKNSG